MKDFHDLKVWEKSHAFALEAYSLTAAFPVDERFGLTAQIRRAASSIPANIAEGCGRSGNGEFSRFLYIAMGSACELEYHLLLARDLKLIDPEEYKRGVARVLEVKRMLAALISKVNSER
ncbi:MAG TPA: four helix bundle protein [Terriglobales bacterium]|nr:four helix bundle protein [Terriglobales bacterium]